MPVPSSRLLILAAACAMGLLPSVVRAEGEDHDSDSHLAEVDGVRILHGWTSASTGPDAQIFMEIENTRPETVVLTGAEADWAGTVTLMGAPISADGEPVPLPDMEIAAGTTFDLTPETVYILLNDIAGPLAEGDSVAVEVEFVGIGHVDIVVEVEAADARQHSHAGHAH